MAEPQRVIMLGGFPDVSPAATASPAFSQAAEEISLDRQSLQLELQFPLLEGHLRGKLTAAEATAIFALTDYTDTDRHVATALRSVARLLRETAYVPPSVVSPVPPPAAPPPPAPVAESLQTAARNLPMRLLLELYLLPLRLTAFAVLACILLVKGVADMLAIMACGGASSLARRSVAGTSKLMQVMVDLWLPVDQWVVKYLRKRT